MCLNGAEISGAVYDIRLCISDLMMLIICLLATKQAERGELKRHIGRRRTEEERDGNRAMRNRVRRRGGGAERRRGDMKI